MLLLLLALPALAAEPMSIDDAVRFATQQSHEAAIAQGRADEAHANERSAKGAFTPQVSAQAQLQLDNKLELPGSFLAGGVMLGALAVPGTTFEQFQSTVNSSVAELDPLVLQKPLVINGQISGSQLVFAPAAVARSNAAVAGSDIADAQAEGATSDIGLRAAGLWIQARTAQEVRKAAEASEADAEQHLDIAQKAFEAGTVTEIAVDRARLSVQDAQRRLIEAKRVEADAMGQLALVTQVKGDIALADLPSAVPMGSEDDLVAEALKSRPEVKAAQAQVEAAKASDWIVLGDWAPTISASGAIRTTNNPGLYPEATTWYVGLNASIPILDGGQRFWDAQKAAAQKMEAREAEARAEEGAKEDVLASLRNEQAARDALEVAKQQEAVATRARQLTEVSFQAGTATALDVQDAQATLLDAQVGRIRAEGAVVLAEWQVKRVTSGL